MDKVVAACIGLGCGICCLAISNFFSIALIVLGAVNIDKCPIEPMIPKYLIVSGAMTIAASIVSFCGKICAKENANGIRVQPIPCQVVNVLMSIASAIWLILGMVWTLRTNPTYQPGVPTYCDWFTYMVAYVSFIIILFVLGIACCCCLCGTALMGKYVLTSGREAEPKTATEAVSTA